MVLILYVYFFMFFLFGIFGFYYYYCRRIYWGIFYSLILGCFLFGWIVDFIRVLFFVFWIEGIDGDGLKKYYLDDVYILWFLFGLFGFYYFYLKWY